LLGAAARIADDHPRAAERLVDLAEKAALMIGAHPDVGARRQELSRGPHQFMSIAGYPYLIVYRDDRLPPEIVRLVHMSRDLPRVLRDL
jgi:plasmid stabilization system protein ParE